METIRSDVVVLGQARLPRRITGDKGPMIADQAYSAILARDAHNGGV